MTIKFDEEWYTLRQRTSQNLSPAIDVEEDFYEFHKEIYKFGIFRMHDIDKTYKKIKKDLAIEFTLYIIYKIRDKLSNPIFHQLTEEEFIDKNNRSFYLEKLRNDKNWEIMKKLIDTKENKKEVYSTVRQIMDNDPEYKFINLEVDEVDAFWKKWEKYHRVWKGNFGKSEFYKERMNNDGTIHFGYSFWVDSPSLPIDNIPQMMIDMTDEEFEEIEFFFFRYNLDLPFEKISKYNDRQQFMLDSICVKFKLLEDRERFSKELEILDREANTEKEKWYNMFEAAKIFSKLKKEKIVEFKFEEPRNSCYYKIQEDNTKI